MKRKITMKRKIMILLCCLFMIYTMTGCQLAVKSMGANAGAYEDRLAGVFVTTEHLDLFDFESYLTDNLNGFQGGEMTIDGNTAPYQERLYATLTTRTLTNEETGETSQIEEYVFEGVEGIAHFSTTMPDTSEYGSYTSSIIDEGISDGHSSLNVGDDQTSTSLEGTIYTTPLGKEQVYYFNPVYQSADGRVYATEGGGFMINQDSDSEGSVCTHTIDDTKTITENGKSRTESLSVKISISVMFPPEKIVILQMDDDNTLIARDEYAQEGYGKDEYTQGLYAQDERALPETFTPQSDTAYLIVETYKRDNTGNPKISRALYSHGDESFETFSARPDGICIKHLTQIEWESV